MWNELLRDIARQSARSGTLPEATPALLAKVWPALVGESLAHISSPIRLKDKILHVEARDAQLVDDWRRSPMLLLRRLRKFSPWTIETLNIEHNPQAGTTLRSHNSSPTTGVPAPSRANCASPGTAPIDGETREVIDDELESLIEAIDTYRRQRDQ